MRGHPQIDIGEEILLHGITYTTTRQSGQKESPRVYYGGRQKKSKFFFSRMHFQHVIK